jgi:hypothetical protein
MSLGEAGGMNFTKTAQLVAFAVLAASSVVVGATAERRA